MRFGLMLGALSLLFSSSASASEPAAQRIDSYLTEIEGQGAAGVALVSVGGKVHVRRGFGSADCAGQEPMTADHVVMIGSITKDFTQLLAYALVDEGALAFDDRLGKFFPTFPPELGRIELRDVIDHTSGLPDLIDRNGRPVPYRVEYDYEPVSREELIRRAGLARPLFEPGDREEYSNLGYNLLAALFEVATGESFEKLLRTRLFDRTGMKKTGYVPADWRSLPFAEGCRGPERWGSPLVDGMWGSEGASWNLKGAGGLLSTVDDLSLWFAALGGGKFLGPEMHQRYLQDRLVHSEFFGQRVMGPAGSNGIFNAVAYWAEADDLRVAIVTSRSDYQVEGTGVSKTVIRAAAELIPAREE